MDLILAMVYFFLKSLLKIVCVCLCVYVNDMGIYPYSYKIQTCVYLVGRKGYFKPELWLEHEQQRAVLHDTWLPGSKGQICLRPCGFLL